MAQLTIPTPGRALQRAGRDCTVRIIFPAAACAPVSLAQDLIPDKSSETFLRAVQRMLSIALTFVRATCSTKGLPAKRDREAGHWGIVTEQEEDAPAHWKMPMLTASSAFSRFPLKISQHALNNNVLCRERVYGLCVCVCVCVCVCRHAINASSMKDDY